MFSQKLRHVEDDELRIDIDPCYEADPYELKLDEMIDAEPEPEVIEGLPASDALTPADRYLELFTNVQKSRIFADSKTFPDCAPKHDPLDILRNYRKVKRQPDFDLRQFVEDNFWLPESQTDVYTSDPNLTLKEHIDKLWPVLTREPQDHIPWSSLLALPQAYIVPGGRFSETYYWDSMPLPQARNIHAVAAVRAIHRMRRQRCVGQVGFITPPARIARNRFHGKRGRTEKCIERLGIIRENRKIA